MSSIDIIVPFTLSPTYNMWQYRGASTNGVLHLRHYVTICSVNGVLARHYVTICSVDDALARH